jgi:hypothetical protein
MASRKERKKEDSHLKADGVVQHAEVKRNRWKLSDSICGLFFGLSAPFRG